MQSLIESQYMKLSVVRVGAERLMGHKERVYQREGYSWVGEKPLKTRIHTGENDEKHHRRGINGERGTFNNSTMGNSKSV